MRGLALDDRSTLFAFRLVVLAAIASLLAHSPLRAGSIEPVAAGLCAAYLAASLLMWRSSSAALTGPAAQAAAFLWDVTVISAVVYLSEGFDDELYLTYFLIMFMSALMSQVKQSFLIGTVASLLYAALWADGKAGAALPATNLLLRFAFFYVVAFFTAVMADRVRSRDRRLKSLELRLALERIANGGWGLAVEEDLDPNLGKTVRTINAMIDNLTRALERQVAQNESLRRIADDALGRLADGGQRPETAGEPDRQEAGR